MKKSVVKKSVGTANRLSAEQLEARRIAMGNELVMIAKTLVLSWQVSSQSAGGASRRFDPSSRF